MISLSIFYRRKKLSKCFILLNTYQFVHFKESIVDIEFDLDNKQVQIKFMKAVDDFQWDNIQNLRARQKVHPKCFGCNVQIQQKQPSFRHSQVNQCQKIFCIWCVANIIRKYQIHQKDKIQKIGKYNYPQIQLDCCKYSQPYLIQNMQTFVKQNCVICGVQCTKKREKKRNFNLDLPEMFVGKQCYKKFSKGFQLFKIEPNQYEKKTLKQIDKLAILDCVTDNHKQGFNKILVQSKYLEYQMCKKCYEEQQSQMNTLNQLKQRLVCENCNQVQEIKQFKQRRIVGTKIIKNLEVNLKQKFWQNNKQKISLCSFCIYKQYLKLEFNYWNHWNKKNLQGLYFQSKLKFQQFFAKHCMVCALTLTIMNQQKKYILVYSKQTSGICSFICGDCYMHSRQNKKKYVCLPELKKFLEITKQTENYSIDKKYLEDQIEKRKKLIKKTKQNTRNIQINSQQLQKQWWAQINNMLKTQKQSSKLENGSDNQNEQMQANIKGQFSLSKKQKKYNQSTNTTQQYLDAKQNFSDNQIMQGIQAQFQQDQQFRSQLDAIKLETFQPLPQIEYSQKSLIDFCSNQQKILINFKKLSQDFVFNDTVIKEYQNQNRQTTEKIQKTKINPLKDLALYPCYFQKWGCFNKQKLLYLQLMCNQCFVKYLLGDKQKTLQIVEKLPNTQKVNQKYQK